MKIPPVEAKLYPCEWTERQTRDETNNSFSQFCENPWKRQMSVLFI